MPRYDFLLDTYDTERLKTLSVWSQFADDQMEFRPAPLARSPKEQMVHQCQSENLWMIRMLGVEAGLSALPARETRRDFLSHYAEASGRRLAILRGKPDAWFEEETSFFDVSRPRAWVLVRRVAHSAHHRGQLTVALRLLDRPLYSTYGPTADTGGLTQNRARVIYRYESIEDLLSAEMDGGRALDLPGPGPAPPTERP